MIWSERVGFNTFLFFHFLHRWNYISKEILALCLYMSPLRLLQATLHNISFASFNHNFLLTHLPSWNYARFNAFPLHKIKMYFISFPYNRITYTCVGIKNTDPNSLSVSYSFLLDTCIFLSIHSRTNMTMNEKMKGKYNKRNKTQIYTSPNFVNYLKVTVFAHTNTKAYVYHRIISDFFFSSSKIAYLFLSILIRCTF